MSDSFILFTGATGGTGATILKQLLEAGYAVNAVIRSFAKSKNALVKQYAAAVANGKLRFTEIPNLAVPGVFDEPAKGASAIIHVATPITYSSTDFYRDVVQPTLDTNENVFRAAAASPSVKRIIITGSIVSLFKLPDGLLTEQTFTEKDFNPITRGEVNDVRSAYQYAKTYSEQKAWEWIEKNKPHFDLVFLLPPGITGHSIQVGFKPEKSALGGVGQVYRELFDREELGFLFPYFMDVDDVAKCHIRALSPDVPGNERYIIKANDLLDTNVVANHTREVFPQLQSRVPAGKVDPNAKFALARVDTSKADRVFGTQWKGWEESIDATIKDIIDHE